MILWYRSDLDLKESTLKECLKISLIKRCKSKWKEEIVFECLLTWRQNSWVQAWPFACPSQPALPLPFSFSCRSVPALGRHAGRKIKGKKLRLRISSLPLGLMCAWGQGCVGTHLVSWSRREIQLQGKMHEVRPVALSKQSQLLQPMGLGLRKLFSCLLKHV